MLAHRSLATAVSLLGLSVLAAAVIPLAGNAAQLTRGAPAAPEPLVDGITVTATGSATVAADTIAVQLRARARAKSISQALADFRAKRTLLGKVLADFDDVGVVAEGGGVRVGLKQADANAFVMNDTPTVPPFEAVEIVTARFPATDDGLETIAQMIEESGEADCELNADSGINPYFAFYGMGDQDSKPAVPVAFLASEESLARARDAAMAAAFADARSQADALATISGRTVIQAEAIRVDKPFPDVARTSGTGRREVTVTIRFSIE